MDLPLNALDIIILCIIAFFAVFSLFRGFLREAFALGGIILGVIAANHYYASLSKRFSEIIANADIANAIAYVVIFIGVTMVMVLLGRLLSRFVTFVLLKWLDKILGLAFGLAKGLIVVFIVVMVLDMVLPQKSAFLAESRLKPLVETFYSFVPDDILKKLKEKKKSVKEYITKESS
jgi:membrane protein required for colicin V production